MKCLLLVTIPYTFGIISTFNYYKPLSLGSFLREIQRRRFQHVVHRPIVLNSRRRRELMSHLIPSSNVRKQSISILSVQRSGPKTLVPWTFFAAYVGRGRWRSRVVFERVNN